jgi:uncharacterized protein YukE
MEENPLRKELESREEYYKNLISQMQKEIDKLQKLYNGKQSFFLILTHVIQDTLLSSMLPAFAKPTQKDDSRVKDLEKQLSSLETQYHTIVSQLNQKEIEYYKLEEKLENVRSHSLYVNDLR